MIDLNTLVQPNSGLNLVAAADINDAGEITGIAGFGTRNEKPPTDA